MAEVIVGGNTFEISSKNKNWTCCDLKDGFLVLVNWDINEDDIVEEIEESQFTDAEHNTFFKSKRNVIKLFLTIMIFEFHLVF